MMSANREVRSGFGRLVQESRFGFFLEVGASELQKRLRIPRESAGDRSIQRRPQSV